MKSAAAVCTVSAMLLLGTVSAASAADGVSDTATTPVVTVDPSPSPDPVPTTPPAPEAPAPAPEAHAPAKTDPPAPTPTPTAAPSNDATSDSTPAPQPTSSAPPKSSTPKKVFVCKYVGTPSVDERLQTGQNPISVSVSAIQHNQWDGTVPGYFSDAHDRSYVLAYDTGQAEPDVSACPAPVGPPVHTHVTPTYSSSTYTCNTETYTVEGANTLTLTGQEGVVWTITKGSDTQTLAAGAGFNGQPPYGVGTYTVSGADASSSDLVDVTPVTATVTFVSSDSIECAAPPVVVAPSATISSVCDVAGGSDVSIHLEAGTSDTTFQILVGGAQVDEETVTAGSSFDYSTTLAEDSSGGSTTVQVKSGETNVTDVVTVSTDCLPPVTTVVTPDKVVFTCDAYSIIADTIKVEDSSFTYTDPDTGATIVYSEYDSNKGGYYVADTTTKDGVRTVQITFVSYSGTAAAPGEGDTYTLVNIEGTEYPQWTHTFTGCTTPTPTPTPTPTTPVPTPTTPPTTPPTHTTPPVVPAGNGGANTGLSGNEPGMSLVSSWSVANSVVLSVGLLLLAAFLGWFFGIRPRRNRTNSEAGNEAQ